MVNNQKLLQTIAKADEIADVLEQVGWQEQLKPELTKLRESAITQLIRSTLGLPNASSQTPQQAAGIAYGVDYFINVIERALVSGDRAHQIVAEARMKLEQS